MAFRSVRRRGTDERGWRVGRRLSHFCNTLATVTVARAVRSSTTSSTTRRTTAWDALTRSTDDKRRRSTSGQLLHSPEPLDCATCPAREGNGGTTFAASASRSRSRTCAFEGEGRPCPVVGYRPRIERDGLGQRRDNRPWVGVAVRHQSLRHRAHARPASALWSSRGQPLLRDPESY